MTTDQLEQFDTVIDCFFDAYALARLANGLETEDGLECQGEQDYHFRYSRMIDEIADYLRKLMKEDHPKIEFLAEGYLHVQSAAGLYRVQDAVDWLSEAKRCLAIEEVKTELFIEAVELAKEGGVLWPEVFDVAAASRYLRISRDAVRSAFDRGELQGRNVGKGEVRKQLRFSRAQVDAFLNAEPKSRAFSPPDDNKKGGEGDDLFPEF